MSDEKKMILTMLSEGKISADEAQKLLEALQSDEPKVPPGREGADADGASRSIMGGIMESIRTGLANVDLSFDIGGDRNRILLEETHTGEFTQERVELDLRAKNGSIRVESWDRPGFQLNILKRIKAPTREQAEDLAAEYTYATIEENRIAAGDQEAKRAGNRIHVALRLRLPRSHTYFGTVKTMNGSIELNGLDLGELELGSMNGSVKVREVKGDDIRAKTVNGSLRIDGGLGKIHGTTTNGSIGLVNFAEDSSNQLETVNGRVEVKVPARSDVGINLRARTTSGSIRLSHSNVEVVNKERGVAFRRLEGNSVYWKTAPHRVELDLRSVNGSIKIEDLE